MRAAATTTTAKRRRQKDPQKRSLLLCLDSRSYLHKLTAEATHVCPPDEQAKEIGAHSNPEEGRKRLREVSNKKGGKK